MERDGLWPEGGNQYRHAIVLPGVLPSQGWSETLFSEIRAFITTHDPRDHQWPSPRRYWHRLCRSRGMGVRRWLSSGGPCMVRKAFRGWAPTPLLAFLVESGLLRSLKVREAMIAFEKQTEVWLPEDFNVARAVVGKFIQGSKADGKRLTRRLIFDLGELRLPRARHPPKRDPRRRPWTMSSWSYPHILLRLPAPVHSPSGKRARLRPYQSHLDAFEIHTRRGCQVAMDISMSRKRRSINSRESKRMWLPGSAVAGSPFASPARSMCRATPGRPWPVAWQRRADLLAQGACGLSPRAGIQTNKKRTSLSAPRRATTIRCRGIGFHTSMAAGLRQDHASDRALAPEESPRLHSDPSPGERNADPGRPGPDYHSFVRWSGKRMDARKDGAGSFPGWSSGTRYTRYPVPRWRSSLTGWRVAASRSSAVVTTGSHRQSPEKCHTSGSATPPIITRRSRWIIGQRTPFSRTSKSRSACSPTRSSAKRYERRFLVASGGNASWRPGGHVISSWPRDWRSVTGPRSCCSSAMGNISRTLPYLYYTAPKTLGGKTSWSPSLAPC